MNKLHVILAQHIHQHGLELFTINGAAEAAHPVCDPRRVVFQQDHQIKTVLVNQRLNERVLTPFVLFTERLGGDKIRIDKRDLVGVFHREINVLSVAERDFVVVGILERHLIAAQMREDIIASVFPRTTGVEDVCQLVDQRGFTA
ncbi:hypothetical protein D3C87_1709030 [compost metagenome]